MFKEIDNISAYLKTNGIKPSYQRIKIYEYLMRTKEHPSVDTIYRALVPAIPTLSKTTVYNTLDLFVEHHIAFLISIEENEARYDADTSLHGHFRCISCQRVIDFDVEQENINFEGPPGSEIQEKHVFYKGLCEHCRKVH